MPEQISDEPTLGQNAFEFFDTGKRLSGLGIQVSWTLSKLLLVGHRQEAFVARMCIRIACAGCEFFRPGPAEVTQSSLLGHTKKDVIFRVQISEHCLPSGAGRAVFRWNLTVLRALRKKIGYLLWETLCTLDVSLIQPSNCLIHLWVSKAKCQKKALKNHLVTRILCPV